MIVCKTVSFPNFLNREVFVLVRQTLTNLGMVKYDMDYQNQEMDIYYPIDKELQILTFLNFMAINDCGGFYTEGL